MSKALTRAQKAAAAARTGALIAAVQDRPSASSSSLSRSYALPLQDVRRILRNLGVQDHG